MLLCITGGENEIVDCVNVLHNIIFLRLSMIGDQYGRTRIKRTHALHVREHSRACAGFYRAIVFRPTDDMVSNQDIIKTGVASHRCFLGHVVSGKPTSHCCFLGLGGRGLTIFGKPASNLLPFGKETVAAIQPASLTLLQINLCKCKTIKHHIQEQHKNDHIDIIATLILLAATVVNKLAQWSELWEVINAV